MNRLPLLVQACSSFKHTQMSLPIALQPLTALMATRAEEFVDLLLSLEQEALGELGAGLDGPAKPRDGLEKGEFVMHKGTQVRVCDIQPPAPNQAGFVTLTEDGSEVGANYDHVKRMVSSPTAPMYASC